MGAEELVVLNNLIVSDAFVSHYAEMNHCVAFQSPPPSPSDTQQWEVTAH